MSDAAIVGIVGILATTVLAPLIAYHVRKDEEGRRDIIDALDGAGAALATAIYAHSWTTASDRLSRYQTTWSTPAATPGRTRTAQP